MAGTITKPVGRSGGLSDFVTQGVLKSELTTVVVFWYAYWLKTPNCRYKKTSLMLVLKLVAGAAGVLKSEPTTVVGF
jgi:hypothetical protein